MRGKQIKREGGWYVLHADVDVLLNGDLGKKFQKQMMDLKKTNDNFPEEEQQLDERKNRRPE